MKNARWIGLLLGIIALSLALAPAAPQDANKSLAQEQLKLARQALSDLDRLFKSGEAMVSDPRIVLWERRRAEAIRASGASRAEIVAAVEAYVKRTKIVSQVTDESFKRNLLTRVDVFDAKYRVLEAEMWLNQVKAQK